jgi:uncharacterized protein with HEPN domain
MSRRRDQDYIIDIQEAMARILMYIEGMTYEQFMKDYLRQKFGWNRKKRENML